MTRLTCVFILLGITAYGANAGENHGSIGFGHGIRDDLCVGINPCEDPHAILCLNFDGNAENGYCWQYGGIAPPYYGAFAECCEDTLRGICGIELILTSIGGPCTPFDAYIWADGGGVPGEVLCMVPGNDPCPVAISPNFSCHDFRIGWPDPGMYWIGYWANSGNQPCGYFVAADTNGFGGCPYTNIAPGIGYPTGWNNVSVVWGPTQAIGIGAWRGAGRCPTAPNPTREGTWGLIKRLYK